jgi:hypothetical protein
LLNITFYDPVRKSRSSGLASPKNILRPPVEIDHSSLVPPVTWAGEECPQVVETNTDQATGTVARQVTTRDPSAHGGGLNACDFGSSGRRHEDFLSCSS